MGGGNDILRGLSWCFALQRCRCHQRRGAEQEIAAIYKRASELRLSYRRCQGLLARDRRRGAFAKQQAATRAQGWT
jgi:hypothetical protein